MINDKQMTINWYVNDLKVYHSDKYIFGALIKWINETYKEITEFKPSRVKIHDYLSKTLNYTTSG